MNLLACTTLFGGWLTPRKYLFEVCKGKIPKPSLRQTSEWKDDQWPASIFQSQHMQNQKLVHEFFLYRKQARISE